MPSAGRTLSLTVKDSLFDPESSERLAEFRRGATGETLYRVFLYMDGPDLPFVDEVVYDLHETFSPPTRRVSRSVTNPRCRIVIWTWGIFTIKATVLTKSGDQLALSHALQYGEQISSPETKFRAS